MAWGGCRTDWPFPEWNTAPCALSFPGRPLVQSRKDLGNLLALPTLSGAQGTETQAPPLQRGAVLCCGGGGSGGQKPTARTRHFILSKSPPPPRKTPQTERQGRMQLGPGGIWLQGQVSWGTRVFSETGHCLLTLPVMKIRNKGCPQAPPHPPGWGRVRRAMGPLHPSAHQASGSQEPRVGPWAYRIGGPWGVG